MFKLLLISTLANVFCKNVLYGQGVPLYIQFVKAAILEKSNGPRVVPAGVIVH